MKTKIFSPPRARPLRTIYEGYIPICNANLPSKPHTTADQWELNLLLCFQAELIKTHYVCIIFQQHVLCTFYTRIGVLSVQ